MYRSKISVCGTNNMEQNNKFKGSFTHNDTNYIKGVAIILMILHHTNMTRAYEVYSPLDASLFDILIHISKCCVAIFTVLSGYGLSESYSYKKGQKIVHFSLRHMKKLYLSYWFGFLITCIFLVFIGVDIMGLYGRPPYCYVYFIRDLLGISYFSQITPTINSSLWYISTVIIFYFMFPIVYKAMYKLKKLDILILLAAAVPWVIKIFFENGEKISTDRELFYFFTFCLGIYLSKHSMLNKFAYYYKALPKALYKFAVTLAFALLFFICVLLRSRFGVVTDNISAPVIILLCVCINNLFRHAALYDVLRELGSKEYDMYLMHIIVCIYTPLIGFKNNIYLTIFNVIMVYCIALLMRTQKNYLRNGFNTVIYKRLKKYNNK